jgi:hypothetical protein
VKVGNSNNGTHIAFKNCVEAVKTLKQGETLSKMLTII